MVEYKELQRDRDVCEEVRSQYVICEGIAQEDQPRPSTTGKHRSPAAVEYRRSARTQILAPMPLKATWCWHKIHMLATVVGGRWITIFYSNLR
jgi:hypothetical protein